MTTLPFVKNTADIKSMANILLRGEPYMSSLDDNYQRILFQLKSINAAPHRNRFRIPGKK